MEQSRPATARGISFSVESLISKPGQNGDSPANSARAPGLPINFSVERLLDKQDVRGGEAVKGTEPSIDFAGKAKTQMSVLNGQKISLGCILLDMTLHLVSSKSLSFYCLLFPI